MKFVVHERKEGAQKGKWMWTLVALNGKKIGTSGEGYESRDHCLEQIDKIKAGCPNAPMVDKRDNVITRASRVVKRLTI